MKAITLLGSTGSIGTQTLDIVEHNPDKFRLVGIAAGSNVELLAKQVLQFKPEIVAICDESKFAALKAAGTTDADIVRLCELNAFLAYQLRLVAGLKLMTGPPV